MKSIFNFVFASCLVSSTLAALAIDTTNALTADQWECLIDNGLKSVVARVYTSDGAFDEVGIGNIIIQSSTSNLESCVAFIAPCVANCKNNLTSGAAQVNAVINHLAEEFGNSPQLQSLFGGYFIQIDKSNNWSTDQKQNQQFVNDMVNALFAATGYVGIITNYNSWSSIVGAKFSTPLATKSLVWVNWNGKADLTSGWTPFGGWTAPAVHQYAGGITSNNCTPGIPLNYSYFDDSDFSKLRKGRKMTRRANTLNKFNRH